MINLTSFLRHLFNVFDNPWVLLLIVPLVILVIFLVKKDFVKFKEDKEAARNRRKVRKFVIFSRIVIVLLLVTALASPNIITEKTISGDAYVQLLVDRSNSMELFSDPSADLKQKLERKISVEEKEICLDDTSNLGDEILNSLQPGGSILLLSDGNTNSGANLGDVALYASKLNTTINAVKLNTIKSDAAVIVLGPAKTMKGADNVFAVVVNKAGKIKSTKLTVSIDGKVVFDEQTSEDVVEIEQTFEDMGNHKIVATVSASGDYFPKNNVYYKTVRVVSQPKILMLSEAPSPLETLLKEIYEVERRNSLPSSLDDYYVVVVNNMPASAMNPAADNLNEFVADGNGLVVFGGDNSFEKGGYRNGLFENLLPVFIGSPAKKEGDINVALVIDISGSTGSAYGSGKAVDVEKALAISAFNDLSLNTRLAVVVFDTDAKMISEPSYVFEKGGLEDKIARLKDGGGTLISAGVMKAISIIGNLAGSKNIILISDGKTQAESAAIEAARYAAKNGIKIYTVGVGASTNEELMKKLALTTNGIYFKADQESRLKLLFGDPEDKEDPSGRMGFTILDSNHFITSDLEPSASLYGFNTVFPKSTSRLLATTSTGEPVLIISRLGLGRVAAVASDDGSKWAGELLSKSNSKVITRIINWAIGDPERKSRSFVEAKDTRINEPTEIIVKSDVPPAASSVNFYKIDEDTFTASLTPSKSGFQEVSGAVFAANYPAEYEFTGMNEELNVVVRSTGGRFYDVEDVDDIVKSAKTKAKRTVVTKEPLLWPFISFAIFMYLLEIFIRRILRKE